MSAIDWILFTERRVGRGHPTLVDVVNRPLRQFITAGGGDPDAVVGPTAPVPILIGLQRTLAQGLLNLTQYSAGPIVISHAPGVNGEVLGDFYAESVGG